MYFLSRGADSCEDVSGTPLLVFFPVKPRPHYMGAGRIQGGESRSHIRHINWESSTYRSKLHPRNSTTCPKGHHQGGGKTSRCKDPRSGVEESGVTVVGDKYSGGGGCRGRWRILVGRENHTGKHTNNGELDVTSRVRVPLD